MTHQTGPLAGPAGSTGHPALLVVDDDSVSVMAIRRAMARLKIDIPVHVARDGQEALEMLRGEEGHARLDPPYMVLLDLNMPRMNGLEFLSHVRRDDSLRRSVVFVFSTSDAPEDIASAYELNAAGFLVKQDGNRVLDGIVSLLDAYARMVVLPVGGAAEGTANRTARN